MRCLWTCLIAVLLGAGTAQAGVSDYLGTWTNAEKADGGFLGLGGSGLGVARVVTTPAGANSVRFHLYGRCTPECDWGSALGHAHSVAPGSDDLRSVTAEFKSADALRRLTLRPGPGGGMRFELVTDFTDHSGRHDFEISGSLRQVPAAMVAAAPSAPGAEVPAAIETSEDCERINPATVFTAPSSNGGWVVRDYDHVIVDFGPDKLAAAKAARVLTYYHFDEQCYIARPKPKMVYWRIAGQLPRDPMPGEDCIDLHPEALTAEDAKVMDGDRLVLNYAGDAAAAGKAMATLKAYRIARQCFVARPNQKMIYWLAK